MASEEVQGIQIPITLDVTQAEEMMKQLSEKVKGLKAKASKSDKKKSGGDNVKAMGKATKEAGATMAKFAKGLVALLAVGKLINKIKQLMDQGSKNLYQYSKMQGGAYSKTLDAFASARESLANSLGALKATFVSVIAPMITSFFNRLVPIINKVTKIVAELFGLPTYWQAKSNIFKQFDSTIQDARELISGFDSLNVFSGILDTPTSEMFEEVKNDGSKEEIKSVLQNIKDGVIEVRDKVESKVSEVADKIDPSGSLSGILHNGSSTARGLFEAIFGEEAYNNLINGNFSGLKENIDKFLSDTGLKDLWDALAKITYWVTEFVDKIVNSNTFKSAIESLKSIIALFTAPLAMKIKNIVTLIEGIGKIARGEASAGDILKEVATNFINGLLKPLVQFVVNILKFWITLVDEIAVVIWNLLNPLKKIEHTALYGLNAGLQNWVDSAFGNKSNSSTNSNKSPVSEKNHGRVAYSYDVELAGGGVFTKPTIAKVGEYSGARTNPEIITPQNLLDERLDLSNKSLLASLYQMNSQLVDAISNMNMTVNLDSQTIARASAKGAQDYYMMTGKSLMR